MGRHKLPVKQITSVYYLHRKIAEMALGHSLPAGAVVHHLDEDPHNNNFDNLVICPNEAYHNLLHKRARALKEGGDANKEKCQYCQGWDYPQNMSKVQKNDRPSITYYHKECRREWREGARREGKNV